MWSDASTIAEGDLVIVWQTREAIQPLVIEPGKELQLRFGVYSHADLIGIPFGSKVASRNGKGFIHILRPTPELWTLALPHRTQILYVADISFITSYLNIRPGSKVIEAGTGSGSFSHSLARTIGPTGHLYTFEFHQQRAEKARAEFERHGMAGTVTLAHRNVCKDGFELVDLADAVFLDLPAPWEAAPHAYGAMRKDRMSRICCFSPCIEQVLRTVTALNDAGFSDITLYEVLLNPLEVSPVPTPLPIAHAVARLQAAEGRKEERRQKQIAKAARDREVKEKDGDAVAAGVKRTHDEAGTPDSEEGIAPKRARSEQESAHASAPEVDQPEVPFMKPQHEVRGHTSYLTFACIRPSLPVT
ncbi:tRNA methyltransferase complex GCD14 subunit [Exidia glandulosa HHB12029]|uniref:tRNA (adenine(58)-N(1))-methyltransferase catalytic subunit TRM61 n=1 Tax=Exidia glandulosa HHB12029 TaxID=1314781 RepID=A0A165HBV9_EXIGL|nr:tRNA methyltransferase complex GCD14 subunit [Exidia glandulosa HHB12029]